MIFPYSFARFFFRSIVVFVGSLRVRGEKSINLANLKQGATGGPFAEFLALRILSLYLYVHYKQGNHGFWVKTPWISSKGVGTFSFTSSMNPGVSCLVAHPTARKWVITPVISGLTLLIPFITGVITHLLSGMSHQVRSCLRLGFGSWTFCPDEGRVSEQ